jgi:hypothetical protein
VPNTCQAEPYEEVLEQMTAARVLRDSPEVRGATLLLLNISDRALSMAQRANERAITQLRLHIRAWQLALDPETKAWIAATKKSHADGDFVDEAVDSAEAVRRLEEARRDLTA